MQYNNFVLAVVKNNFTSKFVNIYIAYDLDYWLINPLNNTVLKNCLFGATNIVKSSNKSKNMHNGYGIAFDGSGSWSFRNDFKKKNVIFGVDNST